MKCVAVGDMLLPAINFKEALEKDSLIDEFECRSWKEDMNKAEFRDVIRKIETVGSKAYDPGKDITDLMKKQKSFLFIYVQSARK